MLASLRYYRGAAVNAESDLAQIDEEIAIMDASLSIGGILRHPVFRFHLPQ